MTRSEFISHLLSHGDIYTSEVAEYYRTEGSKGEISYPSDAHEFNQEIESSSFWYRHRNLVIHELTSMHDDPWILDVGGGNGHISDHLHRSGKSTVLVEPMAQGAYFAIQRGNFPVIQSTLSELRSAEGAVPAVGLFDVIEHIEDDGAMLEQAYRHIRPGGHIYITVPATPALFSAFDESVGHYRRYADTSLINLLTDTGFSIDYSSYFFRSLVIPAYISRKLLKRGSSRSGKKSAHSGLLSQVISQSLPAELKAISQRRSLRYGTSLAIVATKH